MLKRWNITLLASCLVIPLTTSMASGESRTNFNRGSSASSASDDGFWTKRQKQRERRRTNRNRSRSFDFFNSNNGFFTNRSAARDFENQWQRRKNRRQRVSLGANDGPDAASTGERYYTYKADGLTKLVNAKLKQPKPPAPVFGSEAGERVHASEFLDSIKLDNPVAQALYETVKDGSANVSLPKKAVANLVKAYEKRAFAPIWLKGDKPTDAAKAVIKVLKNADQEGLAPEHYQIEELALAGGRLDDLSEAPDALARFDIQLSAMALRYSEHASGGLINPNRISGYHDLKPPTVASSDALASLMHHSSPADWLMGLHPKLPAYAAMRAELIKLGAGEKKQEDKIVVPAGPMLKLGSEDPRVLLLRKRLEQLKFIKTKDELASSETTTSDAPLFGSEAAVFATNAESEILNEADVKAIKAFQKSVGLKADGLAGRRTIDALNGKKKVNRTEQLILNMERMRWLPRKLGDRYVFVNSPSYRMQIMNRGKIEWSTRVIVGKPSNQTYFFSDQMERVEFNPYWGIPQSIIKGQYLRRLRSNPSYFDQRGYETIRNGRVVSSAAVDWWNYKSNIGVRQKPGPRNALGEVKFMFPNKHAIYLHDTPKRGLFDNQNRAYSHGCVRVQNPRELAKHILGWSQTKIASTINSRKHTPIQMQTKIPVHLTYFTAWVDEAGNLAYHSDIYKRDGYLAKALKIEHSQL